MANRDGKNVEGLNVAYVAHLARLHLTDDEITTFQQQMDEIVHYVDKIGELDVEGVAPLSHTVAVSNVWREDVEKECIEHEMVMENAPDQRNDLIAVPKIVDS